MSNLLENKSKSSMVVPYIGIGVLIVVIFFIAVKGVNYSRPIEQPSQPVSNPNSSPTNSQVVQSDNNCKCSMEDVQRLSFKIISKFTDAENELPSDQAKVIGQFGPIETRDNCTWVITFKISSPWGNSDGLHPDEFIKKRIACDGKEVYVQ
jgi:biopolymer transport protein ExbD